MVHGGEKKENFYSISSFRRSNDSSDSEMTDESFFSDSESGRSMIEWPFAFSMLLRM